MPYGENPLFYKSMLISAGFRTTSHINILWAIVQFLKEVTCLGLHGFNMLKIFIETKTF